MLATELKLPSSVSVVEMHGSLAPAEQDAVVKGSGGRWEWLAGWRVALIGWVQVKEGVRARQLSASVLECAYIFLCLS